MDREWEIEGAMPCRYTYGNMMEMILDKRVTTGKYGMEFLSELERTKNCDHYHDMSQLRSIIRDKYSKVYDDYDDMIKGKSDNKEYANKVIQDNRSLLMSSVWNSLPFYSKFYHVTRFSSRTMIKPFILDKNWNRDKTWGTSHLFNINRDRFEE